MLGVVASSLLMHPAQAGVVPGGGDVELQLDPAFIDPGLRDLVKRWVDKSAAAVSTYYGKFPVPKLNVIISSSDGRGVDGGRSEPGDPPLIKTTVGLQSSEQDLLTDDWVLVHEMIHQAIPFVERKHFWVAEGLAVYVESIARVQAGHIPENQIWRDFLRQMPRGLKGDSDKGLEETRDHGRVYWGGAVFFLIADIRIREKTENRIGLQHALRGINSKMDFRSESDVAQIFKTGDAATGHHVLMDLFQEMGMKPGMPDLDALWRSLGVSLQDKAIVFDNSAPRASFRHAIVRPLS
jgi:hypothetical protein